MQNRSAFSFFSIVETVYYDNPIFFAHVNIFNAAYYFSHDFNCFTD